MKRTESREKRECMCVRKEGKDIRTQNTHTRTHTHTHEGGGGVTIIGLLFKDCFRVCLQKQLHHWLVSLQARIVEAREPLSVNMDTTCEHTHFAHIHP